MFEVKDLVEKTVKMLTTDKKFATRYKASPVKALEELIGVNLPDEQLSAVVEAVKGKVNLDNLLGVLDSDGDGKPDLGSVVKLGSMFKK